MGDKDDEVFFPSRDYEAGDNGYSTSNEKQRYQITRTPWSIENGAEAPLVEKPSGGKIYKARGSDASGKSLGSVGKRKMSVYHQETHAGSASPAISIFNLIGYILGTGILGLPYAMEQLGMVFFFVAETLVAILCLYSINLLLQLCEQTNVKAYEKLGFVAFGRPGRIFAAVSVLTQNIGGMSSYLFIIKYELPNVIMTFAGVEVSDGSWYYNGDILVVVITCCVIVPLASLKNIEFLGYTSGFSLACMIFFTSVVIAKKFIIQCPLFDPSMFENSTDSHALDASPTYHTEGAEVVDVVGSPNSTLDTLLDAATYLTSTPGPTNYAPTNETDSMTFTEKQAFEMYEEFGPQTCQPKAFNPTDKWAYSMPTMTFSFVCHTVALPIYAELKKPSIERMQKVSNIAVGISWLLYSLAALFGYLTFYNWLLPELLLMYSYVDPANTITLVVRLCVIAAVILTFPLAHFTARKAITFVLFPDKEFSWFRHFGIMIGILTFINLLVIFVPNIREIFGIIGATASTALMFILPCVFFLRIDESPLMSRQKIGALTLCVVGVCMLTITLSVIIAGYIS